METTRQAVEFGVEIGEYRGVDRVPRRGFVTATGMGIKGAKG